MRELAKKFEQEWRARGMTVIAKTNDLQLLNLVDLLIWELLDLNPEEEVKGIKFVIGDEWVELSNTWDFKVANKRYPSVTFYSAEKMRKETESGFEKKVKKSIYTRGATQSRRKYGELKLKINYINTVFYK